MSFIKDISHQKTPEEQEIEIKRLNAETKKIQAKAKLSESRVEARQRLAKARQRLARDKAKERESSALGQTLKGIKDFITIPDGKSSKSVKKSVKSKRTSTKSKPKKDFIQDFLGF